MQATRESLVLLTFWPSILCSGGCLGHGGALATPSVASTHRYQRNTLHPSPVVTPKTISGHYQMSPRGEMTLVGDPWASVTLGLSLP